MILRRLSGAFTKPPPASDDEGEEEQQEAVIEPEPEREQEQIEIPATAAVRKVSLHRTWRRSFPQTPAEAEFRFGVLQEKRPRDEDNTTSPTTPSSPSAPLLTAQLHRQQIIPWEHLSQSSVLGLTRSSVWNGGSGLFDIEQNDLELDRICQLFTPQNRAAAARAQSQRITVKETVLDHKRATQVSVAMKRLNLVPMNQTKLGKLAWALRDMNEAYLTPGAVEIMFKAKLWPTAKECELLRTKQTESMPECDALLWFLHISVSDMEVRIQAMNFRYEFEDTRQDLVRCAGLVRAASSEVCGSELLKRTLRVALLIGNYVNESFGAPAAWGIHISSLSKLSTIRTADKSLSVLDCIVEYLDQAAPECFGVAEECTCTPLVAAQYSLRAEEAKLAACRKTLDNLVKRYRPMENFYFSASRALDQLERDFALANQAFENCLRHFCLPPPRAGANGMDTKEFFQLLQDFFQQLDRSVVALEERQRLMRMNNQASQLFRGQSGLLNPSWMQQRKKSVSEDKPVRMGRMSVFGRMRPGGGKV